MLLQALLSAGGAGGAPLSPVDAAALAAHAAMLEHGFMPVKAEGGEAAPSPCLAVAADGGVSLQLLPAGWNAAADSYSFHYAHPLRGASETFSMKALALGGSLAVHAASSLPGAELLTVTLKAEGGTPVAADSAQAREWEEKVAAGVALRLLSRHNSTARLGKALDPLEAANAADGTAAAAGTKRPLPASADRPGSAGGERGGLGGGAEAPRPGVFVPPGPGRFPGNPDLLPGGGFMPGFPERGPPLVWTPDGGLLGPRHPAWGQGIPAGPRGGGGGGAGFLPRFDPIGPGSGEPDHDHLRVPGLPDFPGFAFQGGASGRRMDPDGMFIM